MMKGDYAAAAALYAEDAKVYERFGKTMQYAGRAQVQDALFAYFQQGAGYCVSLCFDQNGILFCF